MTPHPDITLFDRVARLGLYWKVSNQGMLPMRALEKGPAQSITSLESYRYSSYQI